MKRKEFIIRAAAGTLACLVGGSAALSAAEKLVPAGEDAGARAQGADAERKLRGRIPRGPRRRGMAEGASRRVRCRA